MWHDLFHCWRNGSNAFKPFIRHLRKILQQKGYEMSKAIWELVDMDIGYRHIRSKIKEKDISASFFILMCIQEIIKKISSDFFASSNMDDTSLLVMIDMQLQSDKWNHLLGEKIENIFNFKSNFYAVYRIVTQNSTIQMTKCKFLMKTIER